jgi:hypothetical protein
LQLQPELAPPLQQLPSLQLLKKFGPIPSNQVDYLPLQGLLGGLRALPTSFLVGRDGTVKRRLEGLYPQATVERMITAEL